VSVGRGLFVGCGVLVERATGVDDGREVVSAGADVGEVIVPPAVQPTVMMIRPEQTIQPRTLFIGRLLL
jgi:hypothetical protein